MGDPLKEDLDREAERALSLGAWTKQCWAAGEGRIFLSEKADHKDV